MPLLLLFTVLIATSVFGTRPLVSYLALSLGAGAGELGVIASSFAILAIIGAIPLGRFIDRVGERRVMLAGSLICTVVCVSLPFLGSLVGLAAAQAFLGIGQMMAVVGAHTMLTGRGAASKRAYRIGLYTSAASLGHALGPAFIGIVVGDEVTAGASTIALLGAGAAGLVAFLSVVLIPEAPVGPRGAAHDDLEVSSVAGTLRLPGMVPALTAGVVSLTAVDLLVAYLPAYGEERQIAPQLVGFMLATLAIAQMTSRLALGKLLARFGHVAVLSGSILSAGAIIPLLLAPLDEAGLIAVMAGAGLGLGLAQPLTLVWVALATPPRSRGLAMGVRMGGNRLGQLLVPVGVGATAGQLGVGAIFVTVSAMLAGAAGYVVKERRVLSSNDAEARLIAERAAEIDGDDAG